MLPKNIKKSVLTAFSLCLLLFPAASGNAEDPVREWDRSDEWQRYSGNPILTIGPAGSWDEQIATFASVMKDDDGFRMYYSGRRGKAPAAGRIGLATSKDGKNWVKHPDNPIVQLGEPGSWDDGMIWCPMVWKEDVYHMIYTGRGSTGLQIGYATSDDGIHWTKYAGNPVFNDPNWAHNYTEGWGVIKVGDEYVLWYNTLGPANRQVGVAVSKDLIHWTPKSDSPVFVSTSGTERSQQFCVFPFRYGEFHYLIVPSQDDSRDYSVFHLYRCKNPYFSENDREFVKKILLPGPFGEWDYHDMDTPSLLTLDIKRDTFYNNQFWLYYSAEGGDARWIEGLVIESDLERCLRMPVDSEKP